MTVISLTRLTGGQHEHDFKYCPVDFAYRRHNGAYRWFVTRAVPLMGNAGRATTWFGVTTDIHEQKELNEQLRDADRHKDEFLVTLAHELCKSLAPIRNAAHHAVDKRRPNGGDIVLPYERLYIS